MHGVARAIGNDVAEDLLSEKGEVSDEVEDFVAERTRRRNATGDS